ncbi:GNAT family N-acetyltransferase [Micromonospora sp. NPDC049679]|uniref:GNAT family N-acetyltransferase n=1 Tax=Micromonospora sp. NPDC049679 TaxID=3155920 RepID=UPI0033CA07A6
MTLIVREFQPGDAGAAADILRAAMPYFVMTPETVAWQVASGPAAQHYRLLIAEADGELLGISRTGIMFDTSVPGQAFANISVHPARRGRGAGTALLAAAEEYVTGLGASAIYAWTADDEQSLAFAARHGYRRGRSAHFQRLDLVQGLPPVPPLPEGVELRTAADFIGDPAPIYAADAESALDEPSDVAVDAITYEDWLTYFWHRPDLDRDLTSVAVVDGVVASVTLAQTDGGSRYWTGMTGTRRAYRGRGLAKLVKTHSLHRARAVGYTEAFTNNDAGNVAMLAVNRWLGYRPSATEWRYIRELPGPSTFAG